MYRTAYERGLKRAEAWKATSATSSATGPAQITDATWLRFMQTKHPEMINDPSRLKEMYDLRKDPSMASEGMEWYLGVIGNNLQRHGKPINDATLYLGYFAGEQGVVDLINADPNASAESILGKEAIKANKAVLEGKTVAEVLAWAGKKTGVTIGGDDLYGDPRFANVDYSTRLQLQADAANKVAAKYKGIKDATDARQSSALNQLLVGIAEGKVDQPRSTYEFMRENGTISDDYSVMQKVDAAIKKREEEFADANRLSNMFSGAIPVNPASAPQVKALNEATKPLLKAIQENKPGTGAAIGELIDKLDGIMAPRDATKLLGSLTGSGDPKQALYAAGELAALHQKHFKLLNDVLSTDQITRIKQFTPGMSVDEYAQRTGVGMTASQFGTFEQNRKSAVDMYEANKFEADAVMNDVLDTWMPFDAPSLDSAVGFQRSAFMTEFKEHYIRAATNGATTEGAAAAARANMLKDWSTWNGEAMKFSPNLLPGFEKVPEEYLVNALRFDVGQAMHPQGLKLEDGDSVKLVADTVTENQLRDFRNGEQVDVSYSVVVLGEDGAVKFTTSALDGTNRYYFDQAEIREKFAAQLEADQINAAERNATSMAAETQLQPSALFPENKFATSNAMDADRAAREQAGEFESVGTPLKRMLEEELPLRMMNEDNASYRTRTNNLRNQKLQTTLGRAEELSSKLETEVAQIEEAVEANDNEQAIKLVKEISLPDKKSELYNPFEETVAAALRLQKALEAEDKKKIVQYIRELQRTTRPDMLNAMPDTRNVRKDN